jgi:uncharacterized alpha-E superfamily protein
VQHDGGFDLLLDLFDSRITYRSLYQRQSEIPPLLDLLVQEPANPRSLACAVGVVRAELGRLPEVPEAVPALPDPEEWPALARLCERAEDGSHARLLEFAELAQAGAAALSDALEKRYFAHVSDAFRSLPA